MLEYLLKILLPFSLRLSSLIPPPHVYAHRWFSLSIRRPLTELCLIELDRFSMFTKCSNLFSPFLFMFIPPSTVPTQRLPSLSMFIALTGLAESEYGSFFLFCHIIVLSLDEVRRFIPPISVPIHILFPSVNMQFMMLQFKECSLNSLSCFICIKLSLLFT